MIKNRIKSCGSEQKALPLHSQFRNAVGAIAQLVEQRTENPCVPGSIPGGTTVKKQLLKRVAAFFVALNFNLCPLVVVRLFGAIAQLVEQRTDIVYKLALCPRFDSWWHHNYFFLKRQY